MKKHLIALAAVAAALAAPLAQAQDTGSWIVRGRALHLDSANKGSVANAGITLENKTFPEVDITYFFSPNLAAELVLTYPQKHDLKAGGATIGSIKHLPPTLSLQYHVTGLQGFRPYVGAGINYTRFSSFKLNSGASTDVDKNSFGLAVGVGADVDVGGGWLLNVDLKKVQIRAKDVTAGGTNLGDLKVDPTLFSIGVGYRF
jgi:outer membrane protein